MAKMVHARSSRLRGLCTAAIVAGLLITSTAAAAPDFIPKPGGMYERFTALKEPRTDVPVGALWVQDYGPVGEGAAADNVETVRSLSGFNLSSGLQLSLTLGLASLLQIQPGYRGQITARFSDLSVVRVKDLAKLTGPAGEPRIYEALKAGTITITTENDVGLDLNGNTRLQSLPVTGRADNGKRKSVTLDGRDMFLAFRIATPLKVRGKERRLRLKPGPQGAEATFEDYRIVFSVPKATSCTCAAPDAPEKTDCAPGGEVLVTVAKAGSSSPPPEPAKALIEETTTETVIALPVPVADGEGGLYTRLALAIDSAAAGRKAAGQQKAQCAPDGRILFRAAARLHGERVETLDQPRGNGW